MFLLFDLSKEHPILPKLEIISVISSYEKPYSIHKENENTLIIEIERDDGLLKKIATRLSFTHCIGEFLFSSKSTTEDILSHAHLQNNLSPGSIAIRYRNRSRHQDSQAIIKALATIFTKQRTVDLTQPDQEIYVIITDEEIHVSRLLYSLDRTHFEKRKVNYRPFFSPISLHPKLARALVNLAHVTENHRILDPFCGTGGFLIEAGLIGCQLYGSDIQPEMITGTQTNLSSYDLTTKHLFHSDIGNIKTHIDAPMDAVITDAPYGKSTTTKKETLASLYTRTFHSITHILKTNGYIVIGLPGKQYSSLFKQYFTLHHIISIPVHRSLTRYFYIGTQMEP